MHIIPQVADFWFLFCMHISWYAGIILFILGNCLNFISFGYAAQVHFPWFYWDAQPNIQSNFIVAGSSFILLWLTGRNFDEWISFPSDCIFFCFTCSHFLLPLDLFSLYLTLHLLTLSWTKWWQSSMLNVNWEYCFIFLALSSFWWCEFQWLNLWLFNRVLVATAFIVLGNVFLVAFGNHQSPGMDLFPSATKSLCGSVFGKIIQIMLLVDSALDCIN